ncbi:MULTISPECIES: hypothetical protein [Cysteiniphilum]|uniref:hypothetical protein n=1 Tax=Cysteiniphilum TaxID=2056696 RepID=UPI00177CCDD2|nr:MULTISPECIES: hypothetical protein [Cysteiniphilum]
MKTNPLQKKHDAVIAIGVNSDAVLIKLLSEEHWLIDHMAWSGDELNDITFNDAPGLYYADITIDEHGLIYDNLKQIKTKF